MSRFGGVARVTLTLSAVVAAAAIVPALASAAVPKAAWYWSLAVPSSNANVLLLGTGHGLFRSTDGGKTWHVTATPGLNATSIVQSGSTIFVAGVLQPPLASPTVVQSGAYLVAKGTPYFAQSTDAGQTWHILHPKGLPAVAVQALAIDQANGKVVYAVMRNGGLYRSTDEANTFQRLTAKIGGTPWALAITGSGLVAGDMTTGAYLSTNGASWKQVTFTDPKGSHMVMEYSAQPGDPSHLLMTSYGVLSSTDGGQTWQPSLKSTVMFGPVAFSPSSPSVAYAVGWDRSLWRTSNGGQTWTKVP